MASFTGQNVLDIIIYKMLPWLQRERSEKKHVAAKGHVTYPPLNLIPDTVNTRNGKSRKKALSVSGIHEVLGIKFKSG